MGLYIYYIPQEAETKEIVLIVGKGHNQCFKYKQAYITETYYHINVLSIN